MKRAISVGFVAAVMAASSAVYAEEFPKGGHVVVAAERLTGYFYEHQGWEFPPPVEPHKVTERSHRVALLGMPSGSAVAGAAPTPRFAADVFVIQGLSLGGSIMYLNDSGSNRIVRTPPEPTTVEDRSTNQAFIFSPRIGYALGLTNWFAIWPRAGVTYANYRQKTWDVLPDGRRVARNVSTDYTDISVEFMLGFLPTEHFVILLGPYIDIPLGGGQKTTVGGVVDPVRPDVTYLSVGASVGIGGYF